MTLGFSAFFAALYLVCTAANLKYKEPKIAYQSIYISERFRMHMYDSSVDVLAFALLYFLGLVITGFIQKSIGVELNILCQWILLIICMSVVASIAMLIGYFIKKSDNKNKDTFPKI